MNADFLAGLEFWEREKGVSREILMGAFIRGCGSEKPALGVEKWLEMPREERIITKTTGKAQLNHEHQLKWEIPGKM